MNPGPTNAATTQTCNCNTATATTNGLIIPTNAATTNGLMAEDTTEPTPAYMNHGPTSPSSTQTCNCNTLQLTTKAACDSEDPRDKAQLVKDDHNKDGIITREEMRTSLVSHGNALNGMDTYINEWFPYWDKNGDGVIIPC